MNAVKFSLIGILILSGLVFAKPADPSLIPSDAKWAVHVDVNAIQNSAIRNAIWNIIKNEGKAEKITNQMVALKQIIGFNPVEDVDSVCLYNNSFVPDNGIMLLQGRFDTEKIEGILNLDDSHETISYENSTIHKWYEKKHKHEVFGSAAPDMLIVASHQSKIESALDTVSGKEKSMADSVVPAVFANSPNGTFLILSATGIGEIKMPPNAAMLAHVEDIGLIMGETDDNLSVHGALTMSSPETAQQITQVIQGLLAFGQLHADKQPQIAKLAGAITVSCDNVLVDIHFQYPVDQLVEIMKKLKNIHDRPQN